MDRNPNREQEERNFTYWATEVTSIHGLRHIFGRGGIFRRSIWSLIFLGFNALFIFLCFSVCWSFFSDHHITQVDVEYVSHLDFPAVTICNFNKYRESAWTDYDLKNVGVHLGVIDKDHNLIYPELYTEEFRHFVAEANWTNVHEDPNYNMTEFTIRTGHQFEDMIISCMWYGEPCKREDFTLVLTHHGACYTFNNMLDGKVFYNILDMKHSLNAGQANGLHLIIDIETPEYTPSDDLDSGRMDAGLRVMLHHPTEPPFPKELGFSVSAGDHTSVAIRRVQITSLGHPFTKCRGEKEADNDLLKHFGHYSLEACRIECETAAVAEVCKCHLPEQPIVQGVPLCTPEQTHECAHPTLVHFTDGSLHNENLTECDCLSPCRIESYPHDYSIAKLRPGFIEKYFANSSRNLTAEYVRENVLALTVFYESLNFETIKMLPEYTTPTFLAVVGGNLGLCLGASFLSLIQLCEFAMDKIIAKLCPGRSSTNLHIEAENRNDSERSSNLHGQEQNGTQNSI